MKTMLRSQGTAMTRNGKIARLPLALRQQVNLRLQTKKQQRICQVLGVGAEDGPDTPRKACLPPQPEPN